MAIATFKTIENHIYVFFSSRPDNKTIEMLKMRYARYIPDVQGKKAWRLTKNSDNMAFVKALMVSLNPKPAPPPDPIDLLDHHPVAIKDVLVRENSFRCSQHQKTEYAGEVPVLTRNGTIETYLVRIWYCADCNCYFILNKTFQDLRKNGVILCKVMDYTAYTSIQHGPKWYTSSYFSNWNQVSPLRLCGYCVNEIEGLTDKQRHRILEEIVDNGILPTDRVMSYLDFFTKNPRAGQNAIEKWNADYNHISKYKLHSAERVVIPGFFKL